jgi:hypothetical protein
MATKTASIALWVLAFLVAVALGTFQRMTGPTYPYGTTVSVGSSELQLSLPRTHGGPGGLEVGVPGGGAGVAGTLQWRRFPTEDPWQSLTMAPSGDGELVAVIPHQPPAGKVEYRLRLEGGGSAVEVPEGEQPIVARFRADVPAWVLVPHILAMFGSMMVATRALLEALRPSRAMPRGLIVTAMGLLIVGGLFLGPIVQKFAFDAYWTGWPFGTDLTDNKTALAVLAWLPATVLALRGRKVRAAVAAGWFVMMGVFLIPHSLRGSEIDWSAHENASAHGEQIQ